jgi:hypothetical protein
LSRNDKDGRLVRINFRDLSVRELGAIYERLLEFEPVAQEHFLHWEVAFPGVWRNWQSAAPEGGFDAVIGNPPWDRMKMQEVEWFAARAPTIARQARAADRKRLIETLKEAGDPLAASALLPAPARKRRWSARANPATTPCCRAATSIFTPCSSNGRRRSSSRAASRGC